MAISKDVLATFDPNIKDYFIKDNMINLVLEQHTVVVNFKLNELEKLIQELKENS